MDTSSIILGVTGSECPVVFFVVSERQRGQRDRGGDVSRVSSPHHHPLLTSGGSSD